MRIWVTRTAPDIARTAGRLEALGHDVVAVPVLAIRRVEGNARRLPAAIVFSSANGVRHHHAHDALLGLPVFAVGDRTADVAREAGYRRVFSAEGDVGDLQRLIIRSLPPSRIVHFCAREAAGDLAGFLGGRGYEVERRVVYATEPVPLRALVDVRRSLPAVDGIMLHSPRAAARVAKLLVGARWSGIVWCISHACARELAGVPGITPYVAARPTEEAMIEMVRGPRRHGPVRPAVLLARSAWPPVRAGRPSRRPANDNPPWTRYGGATAGTAPEDPDQDPPPAA